MAPSPELGGQPKAPDKAGADQQPSTPTTTATATEHSSSSTSSAPSPSSSSSNSNNPSQSSSSGTKHSPPTVVAAAAAAAVTSNSGSSSVGGNNNSSSSTSSGGVSAGAAGAVAGTLSAQATTPQQDSSKIDNMEESDLKALLEEAITYKRPKDREHKSATFNELLSKTEKEDQEQNFPFTSRAVQTKRASGRPTQGGSLQDLPEASLQEYYYSEFPFTADYGNRIGTFSQNWRRHQGGSSGAASVGPGGGDRATNPRQKRTTSSVSSRQREGGSLPSNVNVECSFFNDVGHHHTTGTITKFKKREGGSKSDYGTMVLTAPLITSAGAAELISAVAEVAGSTGLKNTESQLIDGCGTGVGSGHTVIDMGELESDETQSLLAHDALQQTLYDSGLDDYDGSGGDLYGSSTTTSGGSSTTGVGGGAGSGCSAMKKIPRYPAASYTSHVNLEIGEPSSTVRPSSVHHVDKTVSLPLLESNKSVDITSIQLGTTYPAVKCFVSSDNSKSDQTRVMMSSSNTKYIATQSIGQMISQQKCLDENGNSVQQFGSSLGSSSSAAGSAVGVGASGLVGSGGNSSSSVGGSGGGGGAGNAGSKKRKPKSDRNTVLVIPEKIAGYRGKDYDIESLVCYIENKDKQKDGGKAGGSGASGSNPKNGTVMKVSGSASVENGIPEEKVPKKKNEKKKEKGKLKKSNSLEELSSCSRKKQQAEEEQNTHKNHVVDQQSGPAQKSQDAESAVTLRGGKGNKKAQNSNVGSSIASSVSSASSTASSHSSKEPSLTSGGKRGERRSWGTEELSYLEDSHNQIAQIVEKAEEKPAKKESRKEAKESAEAVTPTFNAGKKRDSLRMSVESLSAISGAGVGSETAEFHVVTKKKKMKKKAHSLFAEDTTSSSATGGYSNVASNANNRRHLTVSQSYNLGSSTTVRTSNISGKYQASNSFTNDRDVYMNSNDVSRRKSTSSVPPSEKSDSSDADSVQSLPIEPSRKQQQQQHQSHQSGASRHPSAGVPQSYADIARIPNADRINNNIIGATTSNSSTSPLDSSSVEKWPPVQATTNEDLAQALKSPSAFPELVPESSSQQPQQQQTVQSPNQPQQQQQQQQYQQQHQYVNSSVSSVNNLGNSNKATYSQSLLIATTKATAVEEDDSASRLHQQQRLAAASSGKLVSSVNNSEHSVNISSINNSSSSSSSKLALHKSKSVDTNDIYYSNEEHYPALEKTVKPAVKMAAAPTVTANSNSLLNEPKTTSSITGGKVSPVGANAGQSQPTTTNAPATTVTTTVISGNPIASNVSTAGAKKSKKKDSVTNSVTTDPSTIPANDVESINNARNVASSLDLVNNNPLLIENIEMDFPQNGMLNRSPNGGGQQPSLQSTPKNSSASSIPSSAALSKRSKKDKATMISQNSIANAAHTVTANSNHRPAVIIMNDHHNESGTSHEFTFGFDIDQELLFGDFQEDEVTSMLDQHHQYHHQQKTSPQHHNSTENVPSPTSAISNTSTDLGYSSMQQSSSSTTTASTGSPTSSNNSSLSSSHTTQPNKPPQQYHHHHHHQQYHNQASTQPPQMEAAYDSVLHSSADPDTYRDGIEHKFHQPPPPMVPAMYTQPPPQLPPPHVLAAQQQQQQSARQPRTAGPNHYNLPPPPVVIPSHIQQQPPPALPVVAAKQDTATNTPAIMSVPPPPLPPVVVPATAAIPIVQAVILPAGPPPVATSSSSSNTNPGAVTAAGVISSSSNNSSSSNIHTSLNNQTMASSSGSSSSINSCSSVSLQQEPKPQRQPAAVQPQQQQMQTSVQPPIREKIKEINLRFIAPDQLQTSHNHDKIVNFVGMAWEDVICGTNGSAKYYEGQ